MTALTEDGRLRRGLPDLADLLVDPILTPHVLVDHRLLELARQRRMSEQLLQDPTLEILDLDVRRSPLQRSRATRPAPPNAVQRLQVVERGAGHIGQFAQQLQTQRTRRHRQQQRLGIGNDRRPILR